jgi:hypothetical protein
MISMNRRRFMQAASSTLLLPLYPAMGFSASGPAGVAEAEHVFYDRRFETARNMAAELAGSCQAMAVESDVTEVWRQVLNRACQDSPVSLRGITTETFHFCLATMIAEFARIDSRIVRLDRDLHIWTIRAVPYTDRGIQS